MKDAELAIEMLHGARRRLTTIKRCQQLIGPPGSTGEALLRGLKFRIRVANAHAIQLIQAARIVHPATTPKGNASKAQHAAPAAATRTAHPVPLHPASHPARIIAISTPSVPDEGWFWLAFMDGGKKRVELIDDRAWNDMYRGH